jgi:hypothetical protein
VTNESPLENAAFVIDEEERWRRWGQGDEYGNRLLKAMLLAQCVDDCEALLRGDDVPAERLDPYWLRMYGIAS